MKNMISILTNYLLSHSKPLLFVILSFMIIYIAHAQSYGTIKGNVIDKETKEYLIGANIGILSLQKGTITNAKGYYILKNIPTGTYTLVCSYIGYHRYIAEITVKSNEEIELNIEMQLSITRLDEVVVTSPEEEKEFRSLGVKHVPLELVTDVPSIITTDLFRSLEYIPGVTSTSDYSSILSIRGGTPDETMILMDRATIYNPYHLFGLFSAFNPDYIKAVQLYKGNSPLKYGGRIGSVLQVYSKDGNRNKFSGVVHLDLLTSRLSFEGPFKKGSWFIGARRTFVDLILKAANVEDFNILFYDINAKVNLDLDKNNLFNISVYSGEDVVLYNDEYGDLNLDLKYGNQTVNANWAHYFKSGVFSNLSLTFSRYNNNLHIDNSNQDDTDYIYDADYINNIWDISAHYDVEMAINTNYRISMGISISNLYTNRIINAIIQNSDDDDGRTESEQKSQANAWHIQMYGEQTWSPTRKLDITGGIRLHYYENTNQFRLSPRILFDYNLNPDIRLQAGYGRYYQFLTLLSHSTASIFDTWYLTDKDIPPHYGDQFSVGAKLTPFNNSSMDIELYYRNMIDVAGHNPYIGGVFAPFFQSLDVFSQRNLFFSGKGYAYGIELSYNQSLGPLNLNVGYTYSKTRRKYKNINIPPGKTQEQWFAPRYDKPHQFNATVLLTPLPTWIISLVYTYSTGQPFATPVGYTQVQRPGFEYLGYYIFDTIDSDRVPEYVRVDASLAWENIFGSGGVFRLSAYNIFLRKNVWFYYYDQGYSEPQAVNNIPFIIPSFSYTISF